MSSHEPNAIAKLLDWLSKTQVAKAIFRTGIPKNRRQRMTVMLNNVFLHLHPVRLPKHAVKIKYTWCMYSLMLGLCVRKSRELPSLDSF